MADEDADGGSTSGGPLATTRTQRKVTHLSFDAAGDDAAATRADEGAANLREDVRSGLVVARQVLRGEGLPRGAAYGA